MRVVAGELRGRRLASPAGDAVRPTSDRAREALFSILGPAAVEGMSVLDLFCGTGALGIEALSRGAASAVLVDTDPGLAKRNVEQLALADRAAVVGSDAIRYLERLPDDERFDLILCDPPYRLADRLEPKLARQLPPHLAPGGRIVTESSADRPLELGLRLVRERRYGEAMIGIWRHG
jgi:16S rRNA (guanine966-N2)-methyltransferase